MITPQDEQRAERMALNVAKTLIADPVMFTINRGRAERWAEIMVTNLNLPQLLAAERERDELQSKMDKMQRLFGIAKKADSEQSEKEIASSATFREAMALTHREIVEMENDKLTEHIVKLSAERDEFQRDATCWKYWQEQLRAYSDTVKACHHEPRFVIDLEDGSRRCLHCEMDLLEGFVNEAEDSCIVIEDLQKELNELKAKLTTSNEHKPFLLAVARSAKLMQTCRSLDEAVEYEKMLLSSLTAAEIAGVGI